MSIGVVYVGLLILGTVYALLTGLMGWFSDLGNGDVHVDASGHLEAGHAHPISGTTVATFITGFGGGGTIAHYLLGWSLLGGMAAAVVSGLVLAGAAFAVLELIFQQTQAGSEFAVEEMVGREAEVITTIPAGGTGQVSFAAKGQREIASARSTDGSEVPKGSRVTIDGVTGSTLHVRNKG
jgi:membrane protein implicated in regulation of membrane protease activity